MALPNRPTEAVMQSDATRVLRRALCEVTLVASAVLVFTGSLWLARGELGMVWDEPPGIERQHAVWRWLGQAFGSRQSRSFAFSDVGLTQGWPFAREAPDEHPPVYALLSLFTWKTSGWLLGPLRGHRLATVAMLAIVAGLCFRLCRLRWGYLAGFSAVGALVFNPRLFGHAQLATTDVIMASFWFLAAYAFLWSCQTGRRPWLFGVLAGLAIMSKIAGGLVLPAMMAWSVLVRPRGALRVFAWSVAVVPLVMLAVCPPWWLAPISGPARWLRGFADYPQKVPVYYLGRVYDAKTSALPWHNTLVLTGTMVPAGLLMLGATGMVGLLVLGMRGRGSRMRGRGSGVGGQERWASARRYRGADAPRSPWTLSDTAVAAWAMVNFAVLIVLRMFPWMPGHDGLRQLVPAFLFFAVLAGFGASWVPVLLGRFTARRRAATWGGMALVAACLGSAAWSTVRIHPYELAYYNAVIGGPRGAKAAGMETTYYWDAVGDEVLDWMNANLPPGATVLISPPPDVRVFAWWQRWGRLRDDLVFLNLDPPHTAERLAGMLRDENTYLVFLLRQGLYLPKEPGRTTFLSRLADHDALYELAPARVGVRLLAVFDRENFRAAWRPARAGEENRVKAPGE